jgi:hypothetical protein
LSKICLNIAVAQKDRHVTDKGPSKKEIFSNDNVLAFKSPAAARAKRRRRRRRRRRIGPETYCVTLAEWLYI